MDTKCFVVIIYKVSVKTGVTGRINIVRKFYRYARIAN